MKTMSHAGPQAQASLVSLLPARGNLVVGVSGGADSLALLYLLMDCLPQARSRILAVHVHHGLRGRAADADMAVVERHCRDLGISCRVYHSHADKVAKKRGLSLETAGRLIRHDCFLDAARNVQAQAVVLAHHQDDQAETLLLNLVRGAGGRGLAALRPARPFPHPDAPRSLQLLRPLLGIAKADLCSYLHRRRIKWREDKSNHDLHYMRNLVRHRLLPYMEKIWRHPRLRAALAASSEVFAEEDALLEKLAQRAWRLAVRRQEKMCVAIDRVQWQKLPAALQYRVLNNMWEHLGIPQKSTVHLKRLNQTAKAGHAGLSLPGGWRAQTDHKELRICQPRPAQPSQAYSMFLKHGVTLNPEMPYGVEVTTTAMPRRVKRKKIKPSFIYADAGKWPAKVQLRSFQSGDYIRVLGMKRKRKAVKKVLAEMKISGQAQQQWPLLAAGQEVLWVFQGPMSEKIAIARSTKKVYKIRIFKNNNTLQSAGHD
ncbi:tRNA lysidine(34) synthetase TilS [candidate division FCPU426 bacterium]|nr:tRNA lysidine(34) synthetase TilS [candidate division FCPU426 bacterium]